VFEQQPKLNGQPDDVAVSTVAKIATYLAINGDDDTDYVSEVEALCREIGRGCYAEFNPSPTRSDDLPYTNTPNEQRWTCLYKIVCSPSPAGTRDPRRRYANAMARIVQTAPRELFPHAHPDNVVPQKRRHGTPRPDACRLSLFVILRQLS
jgi:hypothetical protein